MKFKTTEEAANFILRILGEEATRFNIVPDVKPVKKSRSNELTIRLKQDERTLYIRFNWVRDECIGTFDYGTGYGSLGSPKTEWHLELGPENPGAVPDPLYCWSLRPSDESLAKVSHPRILEEEWLRRWIQKKLAIEHE